MELAIRCNQVRKAFPNVLAVDSISFEVERGEVFGLVGPDGAGKTTMIRMMCGIMPLTSGAIEVLGANLPGDVGKIVSDIGYMSQRFSLYGDLTVNENLEFFADLHQVSLSDRKQRSDRLLHASRMEPFRKRLAANLSGGMKQKLALMCTLIHTPKVLFLDEPTTGVDPVSRREFWQILYGLVAEGLTLVVSTPYMDEADRCQRLVLLDRGRVLASDTPAGVRTSIPRIVIDLNVSSPQIAREALRSSQTVIAVEAFGCRLHATVRQEPDVEEVRTLLAAANIEIRDLKVSAPGLEDAFIAYLEENRAVA